METTHTIITGENFHVLRYDSVSPVRGHERRTLPVSRASIMGSHFNEGAVRVEITGADGTVQTWTAPSHWGQS